MVESAHKDGCVYIPIVTPRNQSANLTFRTYRTKGFHRVEIDTYSCNWDISEVGRQAFMKIVDENPDGIKDACCGKCIMRIYVRYDDKKMYGVGLWLMLMLGILGSGKNLSEVIRL